MSFVFLFVLVLCVCRLNLGSNGLGYIWDGVGELVNFYITFVF